MSLVGNNNLNAAIRSVDEVKPSKILELLNKGVTNVLRQKEEDSEIKDGMDIALCTLKKDRKKIQFSDEGITAYSSELGVLPRTQHFVARRELLKIERGF